MVESQQYEFSNGQNQLIKDLAEKMRFVGYFLVGIGVLVSIFGVVFITRGGFGSVIQGIVQIIIGIWTSKAGLAFQRIVDTQGSDINNLMDALAELRKLYALQYWLLIITLVFAAIALVFAIIGAIATR
ncbi:hypothetical protein [Lyngbya aestuarii]|uniref:hypothetical protein n=1 Tax=Lyngbya aestuarii TaxID=118322 RepID=UPI00403E2E6D